MTYIRDTKTGEVIKVLQIMMVDPLGSDSRSYLVEFVKDDHLLMRVRKNELLETLNAAPK